MDDRQKLPRMDKSHFSTVSMTAAGVEKEYWLTKTTAERLEAIEIQRQIVYGYNPLTT